MLKKFALNSKFADSHGRPMHSWRVLLLPFLEQEALYNKYRFDEPWDGPNNRRLADIALEIYRCPSDAYFAKGKESTTTTNYVAVIGPETIWPESRSVSISEISDGISNTIALVEVANSGIHWMEPRDLHVLQMAPSVNGHAGQGISSRHEGPVGNHILLCDGRVTRLSDDFPGDRLRALLTRSGGEDVGEF